MSSNKMAFLKENLETETESIFEEEIKKPKKTGRRPKLKGTKLSHRITFLITEKDAQVLQKKRRAGNYGEIDESVFIREWLSRTGMFELGNVERNAWDNLPSVNEGDEKDG